MPIAVTTRILAHPTTGVERYLSEILDRLPAAAQIDRVAPRNPLSGIRAHAWDQFVLPTRLGGRLLWSPANTGPLAVSHQVVTIHDIVPLEHPEWLSRKFAQWYRILMPRLVRRARAIITVSNYSKQRLVAITGIPESKVTVISGGVSQRFFQATPAQSADAVRQLGLPSSRYVLSVGSLEPRKNLPRLISAWKQALPQLDADIWLVIVGGIRKDIFKNTLAGELPERICLAGRVEDSILPALYAGALVFAYPSVYEGFGLPPLEAMAAGAPVLTGNLTSLPEVVGDAGVMVDPHKPEAIAEGLLQLIKNESERNVLAARAKKRAATFTWENTASETLSLLQKYE